MPPQAYDLTVISYNILMGQGDSKQKIEDEFQIFKVQKDGNALLRNRKDDREYLMRVVTCSHPADIDRLKVLLEGRAQIKNNHILSLVEIKEKQQDMICSVHYKMYLVLEYSFKNVSQEIKERAMGTNNFFLESDIWSILYSCCTALNTLYTHGITHECLTADQIFISKDGFVKMAEPLLFGLEKNHLEAMRTKEQQKIHVHLSPQIMNCLDDQNFFYYEKEKSDIFILAMIIVDISLLSNNYLYDPIRKRPNLDALPDLLKRIAEKFSENLTGLLGEMLKIDSKERPTLLQIIDKIEKYNNISEDFTNETQSNAKSNVFSEKDQEKFFVQKPIKYEAVEMRRQPRAVGQSANIKIAADQQNGSIDRRESLIIKQPVPINFNMQNFSGQIFNSIPSSPAPFYAYNVQSFPGQSTTPVIYQHVVSPLAPPTQMYTPIQVIHSSPPRPPKISYPLPPTNAEQPYNLYQRSKSIDSIKVTSGQYYRNENKQKQISNPFKSSPFMIMEAKRAEMEKTKKNNYQPIFTYQIPEVYSIMVKNSKLAPREVFSHKQTEVVIDQQHVSTPQFHGEIAKVNRFTSFKNYPQQTISREDENESPYQQYVDLKRKSSRTQSEKQQKYENIKDLAEPMTPIYFPPNHKNIVNNNPFASSAITPQKAIASPNPFSTPFPSSPFLNHLPSTNTKYDNRVIGDIRSAESIGSKSFQPSSIDFLKKNDGIRSEFSHLSIQRNEQTNGMKLQFTKEDIPDRGRYEGYKWNNERNGHGSLYFKDGGHYEGEWKNDKMEGFGRLYYENGKIAYEGHWQNDQFNGQGRVYNSEPITFAEEFNYKDFSQLGNRWDYYEGHFKNDSKHGKGYIKLTNGEMYQGLFDKDMIEGNGIFYKRSGEIVIGFWIDNKLFLNQSYQDGKK